MDSVRARESKTNQRVLMGLALVAVAAIAAQASARVVRLTSGSGKQVAVGELLRELSDPDLQLRAMQGEQQVQQARAARGAYHTVAP